MAETIILDPSAETTGRTEIDITDVIAAAGPDWGDAAIEPYYAQADLGEIPVDYRTPNRVITIPLMIRDRGANSFNEWRTMLQAKVGLWQREGGVISRQTSIGTVYADVVNATLKLGGSWLQAHRDADTDAVLTLTCIPDWYEAEIELTPTVGGTGDVIRVVTPSASDHPGRIRIVVDDTEGVAQHGVFWGIRSRHYNAGTAAALSYQAEALDPLDLAAGTALSGASGGTVVRHGNLGTGWTPVLATDIGGTLAMTHEGSYRTWCRAYSTSDTPPRVRFAWDVGDLTSPVVNTPAEPGSANSFYVLDLGEIRLDPAPVGTHRWRGMVQASGESGGENISIDKVWFQPLDEYAGTLRAPIELEQGFVDYSARDEFNIAGTLNAKVMPVGGTWATDGGTDFNVTGGAAVRTATSAGSFRRALAGTAVYSNIAVRLDVTATSDSTNVASMLIARHVDASNYLQIRRFGASASGAFNLSVVTVIGGAGTTIADYEGRQTPGLAYTMATQIDQLGRFSVWHFPAGGLPGDPVIRGQHSSLVTGSTLDDGRIGFYDENEGSNTVTRSYQNFAAWVPAPDAIIHPNQSLEIRTDGVFRENTGGTTYGPAAWVSGDLPRLPAGGLEARNVQILVKNSRGDLETLPDSSPDDSLNVSVFYRPSYLFVPAES